LRKNPKRVRVKRTRPQVTNLLFWTFSASNPYKNLLIFGGDLGLSVEPPGPSSTQERRPCGRKFLTAAVVCKNSLYHIARNFIYRHKIILPGAVAVIPRPALKRPRVFAVRLSAMLALAVTMQSAQAQQTSPEIAFRSTTWNALHTELGRGAPPVGWAFVMTRNGQEIFVDQGGFSRAPWESRDASLPFTVDTQIFVASVSKAVTNAALMTVAQDRNTSLDVFLDMKLHGVFPEKTFGHFVGNISLRNLIRMRSGLGPVLAAGQPGGTHDSNL